MDKTDINIESKINYARSDLHTQISTIAYYLTQNGTFGDIEEARDVLDGYAKALIELSILHIQKTVTDILDKKEVGDERK